jgi:hypothetical protein
MVSNIVVDRMDEDIEVFPIRNLIHEENPIQDYMAV